MALLVSAVSAVFTALVVLAEFGVLITAIASESGYSSADFPLVAARNCRLIGTPVTPWRGTMVTSPGATSRRARGGRRAPFACV
jgi:hypothetical protein